MTKTKRYFEDGIHEISNADYHGSTGVSRSALMMFKRSPYHYWDKYINPNSPDSEPTQAMILGELIHTMVLEPLLINERYAVAPEVDKRTKAGKEKWSAFVADSEGKTVVSSEIAKKAHSMSVACNQNDLFRSLITDSLVERSIYFEHQATGIQCKVRPDSWSHSVVTDLKTTADASYRAFQSSSMKYGYFLQAGMMNEALKSIGIKMDKFVFACVENSEPFATAIYILDEEAISYSVDLFNGLMERFRSTVTENSNGASIPWPSYPIKSLLVPQWAQYED